MILSDIARSTKKRLDGLTAEYKENIIKQAYSMERTDDFPFEKALSKPGISFICEVKKASPSKGIISEEFDYLKIAKEYEAAGADAISVLTEEKYFKGSCEILSEIRGVVKIPVLRKDFVIDAFQIYEAKAIGASAVLLICELLETQKLKEYISIADGLGISVLVEAHDEKQISSATNAGARIIGVNNRNLKDFTVDINNSERLRKLVGEDILFVSESGINTRSDVERLERNGTNAVLIGETLMKSHDKKAAVAALRGKAYEQN